MPGSSGGNLTCQDLLRRSAFESRPLPHPCSGRDRDSHLSTGHGLRLHYPLGGNNGNSKESSGKSEESGAQTTHSSGKEREGVSLTTVLSKETLARTSAAGR